MKPRRAAKPTFLVLVSLLTVAPPAFAYLDPSTGSMILSAIVGMFATLGLALKTYWYKLKSLFRRRTDAASKNAAESAAGAAANGPPRQAGHQAGHPGGDKGGPKGGQPGGRG